eukprot:CAMPEP_0194056212 /NCGR_PEP_ID=MMETSP0009_2-20130614/59337_1 /TAXON_ID=210454 /ORGANISM="Grammatophora oceanica, Strain CCMP 410" /LENGTH=41 /DNA_ID= /DNA_START= /DNA_END= /DNA_ORIENTATION=
MHVPQAIFAITLATTSVGSLADSELKSYSIIGWTGKRFWEL